jgi:ferric-dicitrate binding protein FerR (iron transport regulator)
MKTKSPLACGLSAFLSCALALPAGLSAAPPVPQGGGQRAGEISRLIPAVSITRGSQKITASAKSVVNWKDEVDTQANARARIGLDDGSVLNVGSESAMKVEKHDAGAQQTELELTYGKIRAQAQKIAKPDGKFEVHTPAGVAGVVGTDFFVGFDASTGTMNVAVFEGIVKVCNLAGVCVIAKAGQFTSVRSGDNSAPLPPTQAALSTLTADTQDTDVGGRLLSTVGTGAHIGKGTLIGLGVLAAVPAIIVPIVVNHGHGNPSQPGTTQKCIPGTPSSANCG